MSVPTAWDHLPVQDRTRPGDGYIYLIDFSLGVVKPGRTNQPRKRLAEHDEAVSRFGGRINRWWLSPIHSAWKQNEAALLEAAAQRGRSLRGEFFADCDYDDILALAERMDFAVTPQLGVEKDRITLRRETVASYRAIGWTIPQIAAELGIGWATVHRDLAA